MKEFSRILRSPERDSILLKILSHKSRFRYYALQKIIDLKLSHLEPELRRIYEEQKAKPKSQREDYYLIQLLRSMWKLNRNSLLEEEKEWLKKKGVVLK